MIKLSDQESLLIALLKASLHGGQEKIVLERYLDDDGLEQFCTLAKRQGVAALAFSEFGRVAKECYSRGAVFERMISVQVSQEREYEEKKRVAARYAAALKDQDILCYVLKGLSFASYYSRPELRRAGDCDVFLVDGRSSERNAFEIGDEVAKQMGAGYRVGNKKHSRIFFEGLHVENHHCLINDGWKERRSKTDFLLRDILLSRPADRISDTELLCPGINFNALFCLCHACISLAEVGMKVKMIYDWAALLQSQQNEIDWKKLNEDIDRCGVRRFADVLTAVCVDYFGVELTNPAVSRSNDEKQVDEVMSDVLRNGMISISTRLSFPQKVKKILNRCIRFWNYRMMLPDGFVVSTWDLLKDKTLKALK